MRRLVGLAVVGIATLAPTWAHADDEKIAQEILGKLQSKKDDGQLKGFGIDLEVESGTVWMKGHVASPEQQKMALEIARHVPGVEKVVNELTVRGGAVGKKAVAKLESISAAKDELEAIPAVEDLIPEATTPDVKPIVKAEPQAEAFPQAKKLPASRSTPISKPSLFSSLSSGVARAFGAKDPSETKPSSTQIRQVSHDEMDTPKPKSSRTTEAKSASGPSAASNNEIVQLIAKKLQAEKQAGNLKGFNVDLQCNDGVVWVSGIVANEEQHSRVIEIVRRVRGVKQVVNDLKLKDADPAIGSATHNDPLQSIAEGTGVAKRAINQERVAAGSQTPKAVQSAVGQQPLATNAQPNSGLQMVPVPVQLVPAPMMMQPQYMQRPQTPLAFAPSTAGGAVPAQNLMPVGGQPGTPIPAHMPGPNVGIAPARYDHPNLPGYSWPSYAAYPNYAAVTYPKQYSPSAWPYIGPFYPYPQVPLGWRKVTLQWDDGWWFLDFKDK